MQLAQHIVQSVDDDHADNEAAEPELAQRLAHQSQSNPLSPDGTRIHVLLHRKGRKDELISSLRKGKAQIRSTILLLGGYGPDVNYMAIVKATEEGKDGKEGRTIFDLSTEFELKYKDGE